jgi:hypothetical protein
MRRTAWLLALASVTALAAAPAALAAPDEGDRWLGWVGCWELIVDEDSDEPIEGRRRVCIDRAERGALLSTTVDDREVLRRSVVSDGQPRSVDEGGCFGTERAWWSEDGARLLVESDLECAGGTRRQSSGVSLLVSQNRWSDVQVANVDGHREVLVRRYRRVSIPASPDTPDLSLATATARQAASAPLELEDVLEATEALDPAVVETLLLEASLGFQVNAQLLMVLAEEEVPGNIVDLLVAISYPDYFAINDGTGEQEFAPGGQTQFVYAYPAGWYPYWSYGFAPFGWGWYHYPGRPIPGRPGSIYGGKAVNGRGYTRVSARPGVDTGGGLASIFSRGGGRGGGGRNGSSAGSGSSGGSMTSEGAKGSGSTRTAKRRGSGQQ